MGKKILFFALTFSLCFTINGQIEVEILDQANKFFKKEKFVDATPLYLRLLSLQPKNVDYNYRYGTCLLFNSNNKQESMRYLKYATESPQVNPDAHFYMGRAYHLNYLFNDAVRSYDKFTSLVGAKESEKKEVNRLIQMCQDGTRLLMNYSEMIVYEKKEIEADKFFRLYDLKEIGGNLLVTADFQSKMDKKNNHIPLIYFPNNATEIYYSSYGEDGKNGKDIYRRVRDFTGGWGESELVMGKINTKFDEDFAYRSQDGKYLYFCSKGHNSMGGFDVFRSIYDTTSDSFLEPENMDFAVSSPDDDIFFLVDKDNQNGYFASARQSELGKLYVYKIRLEKLPTQLSIIAGVFESRIKPNAKLNVEVQDIATGKTVGNFESTDDGKIVITFPSGGQYKYIMKLSDDTKFYSQNVNIPMKKNIKPLRQSLVHFMENGEEIVRVLDRFDENVADKDEILAVMFANKAQLDPNSQYFDLEKLNNQSDKKKIFDEISASELTIVEVAENLAANAKEIKEVEGQAVIFEQKATAQLENEIKKLEQLNKKITSNATEYKSSTVNSLSRATLISESKERITEKEKIEKSIVGLLQVNEKVQEYALLAKDLENQADEWQQKSVQLSKLLAEDKNEEALQYLLENKVIIKFGLTNHVDDFHEKKSLEINILNIEITDLSNKKHNYETSSKDLNLINEEISDLGALIETKRVLKDDLVNQIAEFRAIENSSKPNSIASYQDAKTKWESIKNTPISTDYELLTQAVLKSTKEVDIENTKAKTVDLENKLTLTPTKPVEVDFSDLSKNEQETKLLNSIKLNYSSERQQIENSSLGDFEKIKFFNELNQDVLVGIKVERKKLNKRTQVNELDALNRLETEIIQSDEDFKFDLVSKFEEPETLVNRLYENYATLSQSIDSNGSLSSIEREEKQVALNQSLVKSLESEKLKFESLAQKNPTNEKIKLKIESIDQVLAEYSQILEAKQSKLMELKIDLALNVSSDSINNVPIIEKFTELGLVQQENNLLKQYQPSYEKDKQVILSSKASERVKYNQLLALDTSLLNKLLDEKGKLEKTTQQSEIETITRIENRINEQIAVNQLNLLAVEETDKELITRIASDYISNKDQLAANSNLSESEKAKRQLGVDELLIESLEKEKLKFLALSGSNPSNPNLKTKVDFIASVITEKRAEIDQLNSLANVKASNQAAEQNAQTTSFVNADELRNELLGESKASIMKENINLTSIDDLKKEIVLLDSYEKVLKNKENELQLSPQAQSKETQNQLNLIGSELIEVIDKKRKYTITIGDLERNILAQQSTVALAPAKDNVLEKISNEEKPLIENLDGDITAIKEIKKNEKQLLKLSDQKTDRKGERLKEDIKIIQQENEGRLTSLKSIPTSSISQRINKELAIKRFDQLAQDSDALKVLAKKSKSREETNELLSKAYAMQEQANEILKLALIDNKVASLTEGKIATLSTKSDLEKRKNTLLLEEAGYNSEIKNLNAEIKVASKASEKEILFSKKNVLENERQMIVDQITYIDKNISKLPSQSVATISTEMKNTELTFREEIEISSSLEYNKVSKIAKEALFLENEIDFLLKSIDKDKQEAQKLVGVAIFNGKSDDNQKAELKVKEIQSKEKRLEELQNSLVQKQTTIAELFPSDPKKKAKIENLLLRGVEPIRTSFSNYIAIPATGFEVDINAAKTQTMELAVDVKVPAGLMFRVQVGAFAKPVAQGAFQEFSPVTGEKRSNGLTVYLVGFFAKSASAAEAQKTIRSLGYSDAFVVAYCDGVRIPLIEGRKMENSKACAPMQITDLTIIRTPTPKDTMQLITRKLDYNKGIGAAPALPVELKKGLFYTVQIGVYNRPVDPETMKNMTPLLTKRLPNGQIRYSTGVYISIEEAMPKRKEAIDKGVSDAYITAYYGSERISLEEAERILQEKGNGVIEKTAIGIVKDVKERIVTEQKLQKEIVEVEQERFKEGMAIQLVSKEIFSEFPRDMFNRFNKHVSFYFDQNDKRLKSQVYSKPEDIPQINFIREYVDTVYIQGFTRAQEEEEKDGFRKVVFYVPNGQLDGDIADYIYRLYFRKEYIEQGGNMKIILHSIPSNSIQPIVNELRNLKIQSVVE